MHVLVRGALAVSLAGLMAGCAGMVTGGPLLRPGEPTGTITVINQTGHNLGVVLISDCKASTYGLNRLPKGAAISPGKNYSFQVSAGCWDVDAGAIGVGEARQRMNVRAGGTTQYTVTR